MSLADLGNVKGPTGATGPTGPTGPQGPAGPDLEIREVTASYSLNIPSGGYIDYHSEYVPAVSGYEPIFAMGDSGVYYIALVIKKIANNSVYFNLVTYNATAHTATADVKIKIFYQKI